MSALVDFSSKRSAAFLHDKSSRPLPVANSENDFHLYASVKERRVQLVLGMQGNMAGISNLLSVLIVKAAVESE